jgi:hypothetical protein
VFVIMTTLFDEFDAIWTRAQQRGMTGAGFAWLVADRIPSTFCLGVA